MTTILPTARTSGDAIFEQLGHGLSQSLPQAAQQRSNRDALQNSLANIKNISSNPNASNLDIMISALQAGAGIPGSERYMAQILPELLKQAEVNRSQNATYAGELNQQPISRNRDMPEPMAQRQQAPEFGGGKFQSNKGMHNGAVNVPQEATTGQIQPLLSPSEKPKAIKKLIADNKAVGIYKTPEQAEAEIDADQENKKKYNTEIEAERQRRVKAEQNYGQKAIDTLNKVFTKSAVNEKGQKIRVPAATPEIEAAFKKIGEEAAKEGKSEGEIEEIIAEKAKNFSNKVANIENDLPAPRSYNAPIRKLEDTYKDLEQSTKDLRVKLKPFLDMGLYDFSRNLVSKKGYYPEEIENTVNPLSLREETILNRVPEAKGYQRPQAGHGGITLTPTMPREYSQEHRENVKQGLRDLKEANPNFSLVLARKIMEDKKYDSRVFKDALNELEEEGFELTPDQQNQRGILDTPPLNILQRILHGLGLQGR